jgi:hypothetical protein
MNRDQRDETLLNWSARHFHIEIKDGQVSHKTGRGPIAGARATVETAGLITRRITATRILALGVFALAFLKKRDSRELFLTIEGPTFQILAELPPKEATRAREWAVKFNNLALQRMVGA